MLIGIIFILLPLIALFFVVRWAVASGVRDSFGGRAMSKGSTTCGMTSDTLAARSAGKSTSVCERISKRSSGIGKVVRCIYSSIRFCGKNFSYAFDV